MTRFQDKLEDAAALSRPKLWEAPKISEIKDTGGDTGWGRKIYRVVTGNGIYCQVYEPNRGRDGQDVFRTGLVQKTVECPKHMQAVKATRWAGNKEDRDRNAQAPGTGQASSSVFTRRHEERTASPEDPPRTAPPLP